MVFLDRLWGYSKIISKELASSLFNHRKYLCDFKDIISGIIEMSIYSPLANNVWSEGI